MLVVFSEILFDPEFPGRVRTAHETNFAEDGPLRTPRSVKSAESPTNA